MWLRGLLLAFVALSAGPTGAHDGKHTEPAAPLAPGYAPLAFPAPEPGSYALPPLGPAGDGAVLLDDGSPSSLHELFADKLVLLSFIYASCNDVNGCPLATAVLHRVQAKLRARPELASELQVLSLSFDPARDPPEMMRRYGASFRDPAVAWSFLTTASETQLQPILEAYGQSVTQEIGPDGRPLGTLSHVLRVFLIDRTRRIRNVYSVSFLHADTLMSDIETLLFERSADAEPGKPSPRPVLGPGDPRDGYDAASFRTRSVSLAARAGRATRADPSTRSGTADLGLPPLHVPSHDPLTPPKVELGRRLFFDRRLSSNQTLSCAMCHVPEQGFANNEMATAVGIEGRSVRRNAPTILNVALMPSLFHDGRETRLEEQIWAPLLAANEMGNVSRAGVVARIRMLGDYASRFETAFPGEGLSDDTVGRAIASYERTLLAGDSDFDRWRYGAQPDALGEDARRGFALFAGRAGCAQCHTLGTANTLFTDGGFHNTGAGSARRGAEAGTRVQIAPGRFVTVDRALIRTVSEPAREDRGREEVTGEPGDSRRYRTPSLRNVALTAPYMHDGSISNLGEVVSFYDAGGIANPGLDPRVRPLGLSSDERADLVAFLQSLTSRRIDDLVSDAFATPVGERD